MPSRQIIRYSDSGCLRFQVGENLNKIFLRTLVEDETYLGYIVRLEDNLCDISIIFHPL